MPAYIASIPALGAKLVTVYHSNLERGLPSHLGTIMMLDPETGALDAIVDGRYITEVRTAAVSAVSARKLAREGASVLAILGSGVQARSHFEALAHVRKFREVRVWSPTSANRDAFAASTGARAMQSAEDAVSGADVIVLVTASATPVIESAWVKPGAHVISVGACRPNQQEMDAALVKRARLFVDSRDAAMKESGDVIQAGAAHIVAELGEPAATAEHAGRDHNFQIPRPRSRRRRVRASRRPARERMRQRSPDMKVLLFAVAATLSAQTYDIVLTGGRVMDPESNLDAVRNIGITGKRIAAISVQPLQGKTTIDVKGLVVAPGFIDLHSHGQDDENYRYKARDGVTTALEMEVGVSPVGAWYAKREGKSMVNFGATSGHIPARMAVMHDPGTFLPTGDAAHRKATAEEKHAIEEALRKGLDEHALGIGMGIAYMPTATHPEIIDVMRIAAERKVPCYVHMRSPGALEPGSVTESIEEMVAGAAITGASVHIVHITSMALGQTGLALDLISSARKHHLDITTEAYPYTAGQTRLDSAIFDEGWQERLGITYKDLQWVTTGERLTAESFARYRKQGGSIILQRNSEEAARQAVAQPRRDDRQRRNDRPRQRASPRRGHVRPRAGPLLPR